MEYPQGVNMEDNDVIGGDVLRILHQTPARVWVECVKRPILRHKNDKYDPSPKIIQAPASKAVIGGNHLAADFPSQLIVNHGNRAKPSTGFQQPQFNNFMVQQTPLRYVVLFLCIYTRI